MTTRTDINRDRSTRHQILGDTLVTRLISARGLGLRRRLYWLTRAWESDGQAGPFQQWDLTAEEALRYAIEMDRYNQEHPETVR